jgi:hypothetical protein
MVLEALLSATHDAIERVGRCTQNAGVLQLKSPRYLAGAVELHSPTRAWPVKPWRTSRQKSATRSTSCFG